MMNCAQMSKEQLLDYIDMVSFSAHEALLFLDTHPADKEARRFYNEYMKQRNYAMKEYARRYSPLTADTVTDSEQYWEWVLSPWPWEGGAC